jgi:hypothetical protein
MPVNTNYKHHCYISERRTAICTLGHHVASVLLQHVYSQFHTFIAYSVSGRGPSLSLCIEMQATTSTSGRSKHWQTDQFLKATADQQVIKRDTRSSF